MIKNTPFFTYKTRLNSHHCTILILCVCFLTSLLCVNSVSATNWDNVKSYDLDTEKITLSNMFGLGGKIAEYTLLENTDQCLINCYARGTAILYSKERLFDYIKFKDTSEKIKERDYNIYLNIENEYERETSTFKDECESIFNITTGKNELECKNVFDKKVKSYYTKKEWEVYNDQKLSPGDYEWKIVGAKKYNESIDWVINTLGKDFDEWAWWNSSWDRRKEVNITGGVGTLTNFTVLVNITYDTNMIANFSDIRFVDGLCSGAQTTELSFEWDYITTSSSALAWIRIPSLTTGVNTICMYYGNSDASDGEDIYNTWDVNYVGVYHFTELLNGNFTNSKSASLNATSVGSPTVNVGVIGQGANFSTTAQYLKIADDALLDLAEYATFEAFYNTPTKGTVDGNLNYAPVLFGRTTNSYLFFVRDNWLGTSLSKTGVWLVVGSTAPEAQNWNYHVATFDGDIGSGTAVAYINKTYDGVVTSKANFTNIAGYGGVCINPSNEASDSYKCNGVLDELRISNSTRSSDWMNRSYDNTDFSLVTFGDEEATNDLAVTLNSPADNLNTALSTFYFNCSGSDSVGVLNVTLLIGNVDNITVSNTSASTTYLELYRNLTFASGDHNWSCRAEDNTTSILSSVRAFTISSIIENSQTFNSTAYETASEGFTLNLTYSSPAWESISSNFIYNGTKYTATKSGTGNNLIFTKTLDVPLLDQGTINEFYWEVSLANYSGSFKFNSTKQNQTLSPLIFGRCNSTFATPILVNFTIYNETNKHLINTSMDATFNYYMGGGDIFKNYSLDSADTNSSFKFCANTNNSIITSSVIRLESANFNKKTFEFNKKVYNNETTEQKLYLLDSSIGTNVIIQVRDSGLVPLKGYFVEIERYYPGTNDYELIINRETDEYGQIVARLIENTEKYKFTFRDSNNVVRKTTTDTTIACRATICILPFIIEDLDDDFDRFENVTDYDWSFSFNNNTNIFTFSWNDVSGSSATNRLLVERYLWNGTTTVCNDTSTATSGSLTCDVGSQRASYQAQAFRQVGTGDERRIGQLSIKVGDLVDTFGKEGLIWSFFLLMTMISIGYWKPPVGIGLYLTGIILLGPVLNIIAMNPAILIAQFVIGIVFIWAFRG